MSSSTTPFCGLAEFESHGNEAHCKKCGRKIAYGEDKTITGQGYDFPFRFVKDWYQYQQEFVNGLDLMTMTETPVYQEQAQMSEVILNKRKVRMRDQVQLRLYGDRIMMTISSVFLIKIGTEDALRKKDELWDYLNRKNKKMFKAVSRTVLGKSSKLHSRPGREMVKAGYEIARRLFHFN